MVWQMLKTLLVAANPQKCSDVSCQSIWKMMKMIIMIIKHVMNHAVTVWCQKHWEGFVLGFWEVPSEFLIFPKCMFVYWPSCSLHPTDLCWKKVSRALQTVYLSWMVSRWSSCWLNVRPWTLMLGGRISATHWRELRAGDLHSGHNGTLS